jgi:hypothetical protein
VTRTRKTTVKIAHLAMNIEWAEAFGCIFKLEYVFSGGPAMQVFLDTDETRAGGWEGYGPPSDFDDVEHIKFSAIGDVRDIDLAGAKLKVQYIGLGERTVQYAKTGTEVVPEYEFAIENVGL